MRKMDFLKEILFKIGNLYSGKPKRKGLYVIKPPLLRVSQRFSKPKLHRLPGFPRLRSPLKQGVKLGGTQDREGMTQNWRRMLSVVVTMWKC